MLNDVRKQAFTAGMDYNDYDTERQNTLNVFRYCKHISMETHTALKVKTVLCYTRNTVLLKAPQESRCIVALAMGGTTAIEEFYRLEKLMDFHIHSFHCCRFVS